MCTSILEAKQQYYANKLANANTKMVFQTVNSLLNNQEKPLPAHNDPKDLGNKFAQFFKNKISKIREELETNLAKVDHASNFVDSCPVNCKPLAKFQQMTQDQVQKVIGKTSNASCSLDPQPTWLMKQCLDLQLSAVTDIVNTSLQEGNFPTEAHKAIVTPLLKKSSLDREELKNIVLSAI